MKTTRVFLRFSVLLLCLLGPFPYSVSSNEIPKGFSPSAKDSHYTDVGFFDIHICNWSDRPMFYMLLFSSIKFEQISEISVFFPDGSFLTNLQLDRFRVIKVQGKPEKRVFITQYPVKPNASNGWYTAHIHMNDGSIYSARDYVEIKNMEIVDGDLSPSDGAEYTATPSELKWKPVPDARYYKVFLFDKWNDAKLIYESKLITESRLELPDGILKPGGWYAWRIHARDINEDVKLGDFNHGSLSKEYEFSITEIQL